MAFEMNEMRKRKQQREQKEQERLHKQKKTQTRLLIALAVMVACGALILVVALMQRGPGGQPTTAPEQTHLMESATSGETMAAQEPKTVIHVAAAGDLNITDRVVASGGNGYDYTRAFMDVVPLLCEADLTLLNLEGNLCGPPYSGESAPPQLLTALVNAGVDMVQLANSKAISRGFSGLQSTIQSVRNSGLIGLGAFETESEFRKTGGYTMVEIQGVKVAVVAFTKGMDNMALPIGSEDCVNLLYADYSSTYRKVDTQGINKILRNISREKPDITIALLHWGSEFNDNHSDTQESIKKLMLAGGVDAIIGTHPHLVQEMIFDEAAGTFVAYSLGDFFGNADRSGTEYSVVLDLEITKDNTTGETAITGYSYTPIFTIEGADGLLRVVRLQEAMEDYKDFHINSVSEATYNSMVYGVGRIEHRVKMNQK